MTETLVRKYMSSKAIKLLLVSSAILLSSCGDDSKPASSSASASFVSSSGSSISSNRFSSMPIDSSSSSSISSVNNVSDCPMQLEGWAEYAGTTGGGDATPQRVTNVSDLREWAKGSESRVLELEGTFMLGSDYLRVGSNKTFVGMGKNTTIHGALSLRKSQNVIVRNMTVVGLGKDAGEEAGDTITATVADRLWFDHLDILDGPDGILDLTQGSTHATISWSKIRYTEPDHPHRYALLFSSGSGAGATDMGKMDHTLHHNWFGELVDQRMPRLLFGKGHMYNNYYNSPGNLYCIGAGSWASIIVENNYFKDVNDPHRFQDKWPTYIAASGNIYDNTKGKKDTGRGGSGDNPPGPWTPPYNYSLDHARDVPALVQRCAGPQ